MRSEKNLRKTAKKGENLPFFLNISMLELLSIYAYTHYEFITPCLKKVSDVRNSGGVTEREEFFKCN